MRNSFATRKILTIAGSPRVVFLVAVTFRVWAATQLPADQAWQYFYRYNEFARIAWCLVSGHGFSSPWPNTPLVPTAVEPPVYAALLAVIFKLAGAYSFPAMWVAIGLNAVFSAATAVLILNIGRRLFGSPVGILAAWIWSCWIYEAVVSVRLRESSLYALFLMVALAWMPALIKSGSWFSWVGFGVLAGAGALTNPALLAVIACLWFWLWFISRKNGFSHDGQVLASVAACVLVVIPWTIRNHAVLGRWVPVRDNFGLELWLGNHEGVDRTFNTDFPILNPAPYNQLGEIGYMESRRASAIEFIRQNPGEFVRLSLRRIYLYWSRPAGSAWPMISVLAWIGVYIAIKRKEAQLVPYMIAMTTFPIVYYITHTFPTYRHVIEPSILVMAAYAIVTAVQIATRGRSVSR